MSNKIIAAVVVAGAVLATTPFYLSGFFAHKAISEQLKSQLAGSELNNAITMINETSELGLYKSTFGYDMVFNMDDPALVPLKSLVNHDSTVTLHFQHQFTHGFMAVNGTATMSGQVIDKLSEAAKSVNFVADDPQKPFIQITNSADFTFSGHYQMKTHTIQQGFSANLVNQHGENVALTFSPSNSRLTITPETFDFDFNSDVISATEGGATFDLNKLLISANATQAFDQTLGKSLWRDQNGRMTLESINITNADKSVKILDQLALSSTATIDDNQRGHANIRYSVKKMGLPEVPMSNIEDMIVDVQFDLGYQAAMAYYDALQALQTQPDDPQVAIGLFAKLLAEDINVKVESIKAKTFMGPIDIISQLNFKALAPEQFTQNPMLALANLSYAASGEIPLDLVTLSPNLPPELIDDLVKQQMIEVKDEQILFNLTGKQGHLNLNGKPLL